MKKSVIFLLFLLGMLLFPNITLAKDYSFKIGDNSEWNKNNIDILNDKLVQLYEKDEEDYIMENKYILDFEDGDYDYSDIVFEVYGTVEYHFGNGNYRFSNFEGAEAPLTLKGMGIDNTKVFVNEFSLHGNYFDFSDLTISSDGEYGSISVNGEYEYLKKYGLESMGLNFKNVAINLSNSLEDLIFMFYSESYPNSMFFDNVSINGVDSIIIEIMSYFVIPGNEKYYVIKNSDFSKQNIIFESEESHGKPPVYFENTKLNRIYALDREVYIDCDSVFVNGIKRGSGEDGSEIFREGDYTIYEYNSQYEYGDVENGKIVLETCKQKELKMNSKISFADVKKEFGYELDESWLVNSEKIVEIKDGYIFPLKVGNTKISKETDGELLTLKVIVTDVLNEPILTNPQTGISIIDIIILVFIIFGGSYLVFKKKC